MIRLACLLNVDLLLARVLYCFQIETVSFGPAILIDICRNTNAAVREPEEEGRRKRRDMKRNPCRWSLNPPPGTRVVKLQAANHTEGAA